MGNILSLVKPFQEGIYILKASSPKKSALTVTAAVSLAVLYSVYTKFLLPPTKLSHFPRVNFFKYTLRLLQQRPYSKIQSELTIPLLDPIHGEMYLKNDRLGWTVFIANPEVAKTFFLKTDIFPKAGFTVGKGTLFHSFVGSENIVFSDKEEWKKHRKLVNPSFHRQMPVKLFGELTKKVLIVLDQQENKPVDILDIMERFALDAIGIAGFGFDFNAILDKNNEWVKSFHQIKDGIGNPLFFIFPSLETDFLWLLREQRRRHQVLKNFQSMMDGVIEQKRRILREQRLDGIEETEKDLLTLMLEAEQSGEGALTNEELKNDLNVFFMAGQETTANSLSFAIHALARDPSLQQRAREEALSVLGDGPEDVFPTAEQIKHLPFITQIIKETLRMNCPVTEGVSRRVTQDIELAGKFIPKDTPIAVSIYDTHHNPYVWKDPERFDPDRFAPGGEAEQQARGSMAWIPFYNGQRMCLGMNFSLNEQKVMLPALLRRYEWCLPDNSIHKTEAVLTTIGIIAPKDLEIIFKRRS